MSLSPYTRPGRPEKVFDQRKIISFGFTTSNPATSDFVGHAEVAMCASDGEIYEPSKTGIKLTSAEVKALMATNETVRQAFLSLPPAIFAVFDQQNSQ